jgi:hypothetical protein
MRQWMFVVAVVCGIVSTSGASANVWSKPQIGEKTSAAGYKPVMLACGRMVMKRGVSQDLVPAKQDKATTAHSGSALITSR